MNEPERGYEPDRAGSEHDRDDHEERVPEVEGSRDGPAQALKIEDEVVN